MLADVASQPCIALNSTSATLVHISRTSVILEHLGDNVDRRTSRSCTMTRLAALSRLPAQARPFRALRNAGLHRQLHTWALSAQELSLCRQWPHLGLSEPRLSQLQLVTC